MLHARIGHGQQVKELKGQIQEARKLQELLLMQTPMNSKASLEAQRRAAKKQERGVQCDLLVAQEEQQEPGAGGTPASSYEQVH